MIFGLHVGIRGGDQSIGFTVIREVHVRLIGISAATWGYIAFVWLCCVTVRAKGYRPALGFIGATIIGGLVIPFLPAEESGPLSKRTPFAWIGARHLFALFAVWVLVVLAFWNSFDSTWVLDNLYIIKYDPRTRAETWDDPPTDSLLRSPGVMNYFMQDYWWPKGISGLYRPLTGLTYWLNWTVLGQGGEDPHGFKTSQMVRGFHAVNLVVHWLNAALLYALAFVLTRRWGIAIFAAVLFAVHPITTESVTNIIGRADLFAALAVLGGLLVWRWGAQLPGRSKLWGFILVMLITAFGVFSKESAIAMGLVILVYDIAYRWNPIVAKWLGTLLLVLLVPAISGASFAIAKTAAGIPLLLRGSIAIALIAVAAAIPRLIVNKPPRIRLVAFSACVLLAIIASAFVPVAGVAIIVLLGAIEFFIGPWLARSFPEFDRIKLAAFAYTAGFTALVFLPLALGGWIWFASGAVAKHSLVGTTNVLLGTWPFDVTPNQSFDWVEQYTRAGMLVLSGMMVWIYFTAARRAVRAISILLVPVVLIVGAILLPDDLFRLMTAARVAVIIAFIAAFSARRLPDAAPWLALAGVLLIALSACLFVFWAGFVLTFIVGLMELISRSFMPRVLRENPTWNRLVQNFAVGYYLLLPPVIAMFFVRYWIFNIVSTPPETPFLDNPLRGGPFDPLPFWQSRMTAIKVIGKLIYLLFLPVHLSSDYSWDELPFFTWRLWQWENLKTIVALLTIITLIWVACRNYTRNKPLFFFIMFFFVALLPTSNLPTLIGSIMAERFLYLPLIGFAGAIAVAAAPLADWVVRRWATSVPTEHPSTAQSVLAWLHSHVPIRAVVYVALPLAVAMLLTTRAYVRNFDWYEDVTLWEAARVISPRSFRCYQSLAFAYYERHPKHYIDKMVEIAEQGRPIVDPLSLDRNSSRLYLHLGMYYNIKGELLSERDRYGNLIVTPAARPWFQRAVDVLLKGVEVDRSFNEINLRRQLERGDKLDKIYDAGLTPVYMTLGISYARLNMYREAYHAYNYQRQLEPENSDPYVRLALMRIDQGNLDEAAVDLVQALLLDFKRTDAWSMLMQIYGAMGPAAQNAITRGPQGPKLNVDNPLVRDHFIRAYRGFIRIFRLANRPQAAETARRIAIFRYGMPPSLFDSVMVEPIRKVTPFGL